MIISGEKELNEKRRTYAAPFFFDLDITKKPFAG
jgi:hypothetical protein